MATKKQKREAGEARQAVNFAESKRSGLVAQSQAKKARDLRRKAAEDEAKRLNQRHNAILAMHGLGKNAINLDRVDA